MYKDKTDALDQEWIDLILEALDAGIALQDIEHFFPTYEAGHSGSIGLFFFSEVYVIIMTS